MSSGTSVERPLAIAVGREWAAPSAPGQGVSHPRRTPRNVKRVEPQNRQNDFIGIGVRCRPKVGRASSLPRVNNGNRRGRSPDRLMFLDFHAGNALGRLEARPTSDTIAVLERPEHPSPSRPSRMSCISIRCSVLNVCCPMFPRRNTSLPGGDARPTAHELI